MRKLIVMRGVPGSGKSYEAQRIAAKTPGSLICSTDDFHMVIDHQGRQQYQFQPSRLGEFHSRNQEKVAHAMRDNSSLIIVDNTNITGKEILPYARHALEYEYSIELCEARSPWWLAVRPHLGRSIPNVEKHASQFASRNTHGVPLNAIIKMLDRWENVEQFDAELTEIIDLLGVPDGA